MEQNPLLMMIKNHLKGSHNYLLGSFSADPQRFDENYKWINELAELVTCIQTENTAFSNNYTFAKRESSLDLSSKLKGVENDLISAVFAKSFLLCPKKPTGFSERIISNLSALNKQISTKRYSSMREYR